MHETCCKCNNWLSHNMFLVVLSGLAVGFCFPLSDSQLLRIAVIALFGYMTFVTALGTSLRQFGQILGRPWISIWILFLIHIVTPLMAWGVGLLLYPGDEMTRLGYLVAASVPVGVTSVIWTSLSGGNVPISLVSVTLDTLIVPAFLPYFFKLTLGQTVHINYLEMAEQLMWMITIPSVVGMITHDLTHGKSAEFGKGLGGVTSKISLFIVILINASLVGPSIHWNLTILKMVAVTLAMVAAGYLLGYLGALILPNRNKDVALAMIFSVGLRNISSGVVLALAYFPPAAAVPITLYMLFQQPLAAVIPSLYHRFQPSPSEGTC